MKRPIGLHVRLQQDLFDVISAVENMNLSVVQSFLINEQGDYLSYKDKVIHEFTKEKDKLNILYFIHAAYWSSLTNVKSKEFLSLCKETELAKNLESQGIVIHVGATRTKLSKADQAKYVAEGINTLFDKVSDISILLENGPHAGRNFGGDITDFSYLDGLIEQKNRVKYCIDTAHAFVYGYNIAKEYDREQFFNLLNDTFQKDSIGLLHLNDTDKSCGSRIDKHGIAGEGLLAEATLKNFINFSLFQQTPIILELPSSCSNEKSLEVLKRVISWSDF